LPPVFDSDKYVAFSVQLKTVRLNGVCTIGLGKLCWTLFVNSVRMSPFLNATMPRLNPQSMNYVKKLTNLRDRCSAESVCRQTRKSLTHLQRPLVGMQPGAKLQLQLLDRRLLLHLRKNLLIEGLPWTLPRLFLRLSFPPCKYIHMVSGLSPTRRRQPLVPQQ
jgi:hypothetical protein